MIAILIPAYNEEKNITKTIRAVDKIVKTRHRFYVVDDGSRDKTNAVIRRLMKKHPITLLSHRINRGVAEALKTGLEAIVKSGKDTDTLIIMEADGTSDPKLAPHMLAALSAGSDIVIASRHIPRGRYLKFPLKRLFLSYAANLTFRTLFPHPTITDYTIFYRAYKLGVVKKAMEYYGKTLLISKFFTANTELLIKLTDFSDRISEVPFVYNYGLKTGRSGLKTLPNLREYFKFIIAYKLLKPHE